MLGKGILQAGPCLPGEAGDSKCPKEKFRNNRQGLSPLKLTAGEGEVSIAKVFIPLVGHKDEWKRKFVFEHIVCIKLTFKDFRLLIFQVHFLENSKCSPSLNSASLKRPSVISLGT